MNGIRDLAALAADDAAVEREISVWPRDVIRIELDHYADDWDARVEAMEDQANRRALVLPRWFWPINVALLALAAVALAWR